MAPGLISFDDLASEARESSRHDNAFGTYEIQEQPIHTRRPIRVVCLGAGYSGILMGIIWNQRMQNRNAELVIYERNDDLGGTWLENRYYSTSGPFCSY
jgi:hypothetical protein